MQKSVLWAEDLEGHRQPSLYYLSDEEGADGPHLICDWNGAPTDLSEIDLDSFALFKDETVHDEANQGTDVNDENVSNKGAPDDEFVDYPNPAADIGLVAQDGVTKAQPTCRQNDLDFIECAHFDFLSVPPMTSGLVRRFVSYVMYLGALKPGKKSMKK